MDFVLEFLSANSIAAVHLSRLGEEWVLWASEEFGFLIPSDSVSTRSSIMPQKKNPDPMELIRGKSARVVGDLVTLLVLCKDFLKLIIVIYRKKRSRYLTVLKLSYECLKSQPSLHRISLSIMRG